MKIYDRNLTGSSAAETGRSQESQNPSRAGTVKSSTSGVTDGSGIAGFNDRVEFSGTLGQLSRSLATFEATRSSRVQALAVDYQNGKYLPNSAATSKGMIAEVLSAGPQ